jgi:hypothetical protein
MAWNNNGTPGNTQINGYYMWQGNYNNSEDENNNMWYYCMTAPTSYGTTTSSNYLGTIDGSFIYVSSDALIPSEISFNAIFLFPG